MSDKKNKNNSIEVFMPEAEDVRCGYSLYYIDVDVLKAYCFYNKIKIESLCDDEKLEIMRKYYENIKA